MAQYKLRALCALVLSFLAFGGLRAPLAHGQELSAQARQRAVRQMRTLGSCLEREQARLERALSLVEEAEEQLRTTDDSRVRRDGEQTIEALVAQAADVQRAARACLGSDLPSPGTRIVERHPAPDASADHVAQAGSSLRLIGTATNIARQIRFLGATQLDGIGSVRSSSFDRGMRTLGPRLSQCYNSYLDRGTATQQSVDLVVSFAHSGRAGRVTAENSQIRDSAFESCLVRSTRSLSIGSIGGGQATLSLHIQFGNAD